MKKFSKLLAIGVACVMSFSAMSISTYAETSDVQALIEADPTRDISKDDLLIPNEPITVDESKIITDETVIMDENHKTRSSFC